MLCNVEVRYYLLKGFVFLIMFNEESFEVHLRSYPHINFICYGLFNSDDGFNSIDEMFSYIEDHFEEIAESYRDYVD